MITLDEYNKAKSIIKQFETETTRYFDPQQIYYIDMGLGCYRKGKFDGIRDGYFMFKIKENNWCGASTLDNIYVSKQNFMKYDN